MESPLLVQSLKTNRAKNLQLFLLHNFSWVLVIVLFLVLGAVRITFLRPQTILYMLYISSLSGFIIYGQALCLISGNFDMSIDRIAGISPLIGALMLTRWFPGMPGVVAIVFVIIFAIVLGFVNGALVGKLGVNSFLATLATYLIYLYLAYFLLDAPIGSNQLPPIYFWLGSAHVGGFNVAFIVFVIVGIVLHFVLRRTSFGINIYATGGDVEISRALGINTSNVTVMVYTVAGGLAGLCGLAFVGFVGAVTNSVAAGQVFWTFAGAIIGGVSLRGGRGSIMNVIAGAIFVGLVTTGVLVFNITDTLRMVIAGIIILISILVARGRELLEERLLKT